MGDIPSLFSLCTRTIARTAVGEGYSRLQDVFDLPSDVFDCLLMHLPPLALLKLHEALCFDDLCGSTLKWTDDGRKRGRYGDFCRAWQLLFRLRWPDHDKQVQQTSHIRAQETVGSCEDMDNINWQQLYWETHLQNCLDEASEKALLPAFDGCIKEIEISNTIMEFIGCNKDSCSSACEHVKLSYHCQKFGRYARCLRLQNVLCVAGTCELLKAAKLQGVVFRNIKSETHVDEVCKLLKQNNETLLSLKFVHCRFSFTGFDKVFSSVYYNGNRIHGIKCFSVTSSSVFKCKQSTIPLGLLDFLSSGRSLYSLKFCDIGMGPRGAKMIFKTLQEASSGLLNLDISDENISGWLSNIDRESTYFSLISSSPKASLTSLCVLNLRGNNLGKDDAEDLRYALVHMPCLRRLDISDNPLTDDGIRSLIPYFIEALERAHPLSDIKIENCSLSSLGVIQLLESLQNSREPLHSLSLADNDLGSCIGVPVAVFLGASHVKELNIEGVGLGPLGFQELEHGVPGEVGLTYINISKNRGRVKAADFVSKIISQAPELRVVNAGYNFIPPESLSVICNALKHSKGKLESLDLTGNDQLCEPTSASVLADFCFHGRRIVVLPPLPSTVPYDDDP